MREGVDAADGSARLPIVSLRDVAFAYPSPEGGEPRLALDGISLDIHEGEHVAILGHNGSGKSTLSKLLNALLLPRQGQVLVDGHDTREAARDPARLRDVRRTVGLVFQNPDNQIVATVVEEDVAFGPENLGVERAEIHRRVDESLAAVDLSALRLRPPHHLSGGQRQRVAIAGILAMRPRVLVLDEATAMLDPLGRREVLAVAEHLNREMGTSLVQITHFMHEAVLANRVVVLDRGRIALEGSPREVFSQVGRLHELRLDVPQVAELAERLHRQVPGIPASVISVDEMVEAVVRYLPPPTGERLPPEASPVLAAGSAARLVAGRANDLLPAVAATTQSAAGSTPTMVAEADALVLDVADLWHTYMRGTPLAAVGLRGVSFQVRQGEIAGLIGHTGSGKSTLVQHLNGLMRPQQGRVVVDGLDLANPRTDLRVVRRTVGLVFQFPEQQLFEPTVGDDIAYGPRRMGLDREEVRRRVREAMEAVGLGFEAFKDRYTFGLSGGEMRRVAIAGVLALEPRVLVLDEPTASLDPRGRDELTDALLALHRERGVAIVFVSHNMEEVAALVERVWVLAGGRTVLSGPVREVFRETEVLHGYGLGVPQVTSLMHDLRARGYPVRTDVLTVDEAVGEVAAWTSSTC